MAGEDVPPVILGAAGLTGRPLINRDHDLVQPIGEDESGAPIFAEPPQPSKAIPPNCLRILNSPLHAGRGGGCSQGCVGLQADGGCLTDIVKRAQAAGVDWLFEVSYDGYGNQVWSYAGPPLPEPPE